MDNAYEIEELQSIVDVSEVVMATALGLIRVLCGLDDLLGTKVLVCL